MMLLSDVRAAAAARPDLAALAALLVAGGGLRLWLMLEWRPAFLGYPDSWGYISNSQPDDYFQDGFRSIGYPLFLAAGRALSSSLSTTVVLQHALGMAAALCAYVAARALGVGRWPALIPAAVLLLHGPSIWFEHAILTESIFPFVLCAALAAAALAAGERIGSRSRIAVAALAGALLAYATSVRPITLVCLPLVVAWLAAARPRAIRTQLPAAAALLGTGGALVLANLAWAESVTGRFSFARHDYKDLYGRVAPFADCGQFTPPDETEFLCPTGPRSARPGPVAWVFGPESPLQQIKEAGMRSQPADAHERVNAFSRAAIVAQPGDYATAVGRELVRLVDPDFPLNPNRGVGNGGAGEPPYDYPPQLIGATEGARPAEAATVDLVGDLYSTEGIHRGNTAPLRTYERLTRLNGVPWLMLVLLAATGPFLLRARERRAAAMTGAVALVLTVAPIAFHTYNWRYQVVTLGPLAIAAAFGVQGVADRLARRLPSRG